MLGLDPSIPETSYLVMRFSGLRFASPENDGFHNGKHAFSSQALVSPSTSGESFAQTCA